MPRFIHVYALPQMRSIVNHNNADRDIVTVLGLLRNHLQLITFSEKKKKKNLSSCELLTSRSYLHRLTDYIKAFTDVLLRDLA